MSDQNNQPNPTFERVFQAIRDSWSAETCGEPNEWSLTNPSWQQCDASAFVAWEHLGGELVLGKVTSDGADAGFHYWNRIDGQDFDLTRTQFVNGETIDEIEVLSVEFLNDNFSDMKPDVQARIAVMRSKVNDKLVGDLSLL